MCSRKIVVSTGKMGEVTGRPYEEKFQLMNTTSPHTDRKQPRLTENAQVNSVSPALDKKLKDPRKCARMLALFADLAMKFGGTGHSCGCILAMRRRKKYKPPLALCRRNERAGKRGRALRAKIVAPQQQTAISSIKAISYDIMVVISWPPTIQRRGPRIPRWV